MAVNSTGSSSTGLRRGMGPIGLLFAALGGIIGSGWLLGSLSAAQTAGPAALISWIIGGLAVLLIALIYAELGSMFPVAGGVARYPQYSHGSLASFSMGWISWLAYVTVAPIEVEATIQYASNYLPNLLHTAGGQAVLSPVGYLVAALLMLLFTWINYLGVRSLSLTNSTITWWKLIIPTLTFLVLLAVSFHGSNLSAQGGFAPYGLQGILSAVSTSGIVFSYLGFRQAVELAGETTNPQRNVPMALIWSVVIGIVIYFFLQLAFLGALQPGDLAKGWGSLSFTGSFGPFAGIAGTLGLGWLAVLLYIDAIVSPGGTGLIYTGSTARLSYAMARNGYIPSIFAQINPRTGVPVFSILFTFIIGLIVFLPFPSWQSLVGFLSSASVMSYGVGPLVLIAMRRQDPKRVRPYRLPAGNFWATVGFIVVNLIIYWTGWATDEKLFLAIALGLILFAISYSGMRSSGKALPKVDWVSGAWIWPYFIGMAIISYLGTFGGGTGFISLGWSFVVIIIFSLLILWMATANRLSDAQAAEYIGDLS